ncbi:hypothetical protein FACS189487_08770 [Campylobacterota bacterium]|nr:hypothetical protein FACS189487_08770 [Campylobacterota bacterium]
MTNSHDRFYVVVCDSVTGLNVTHTQSTPPTNIPLDPDTWDISVKVYYGTTVADPMVGEAIASGVVITNGQTTPVTVNLTSAVQVDTLTLANGKTAEGGNHGLGEPFQARVTANYKDSGGTPISALNGTDVTGSSDVIISGYDNTTAGSNTVTAAVGGLSSATVTVAVKTLKARVADADTAGGSHTLVVYQDETFAAAGSQNITIADITIRSSTAGGIKEITLTGTGYMFNLNDVGGGARSLTLQDITLKGLLSNTNPLVQIGDGSLTMNSGSTITNNEGDSLAGGVYVGSNCSLTMNPGSSISGNKSTSSTGGVVNNGTFTMNGGTISGNEGINFGGGVYNNGTFDMYNGVIINNKDTGTYGSGGGVYLTGGTFTMHHGEISGNEATTKGGGVYAGAPFTMDGGTISGNQTTGAGGDGGGVYVAGWGTFTKTDSSAISANTATGQGQQVYVIDNGGTGRLAKYRNDAAGTSVDLNSETAPGWGL